MYLTDLLSNHVLVVYPCFRLLDPGNKYQEVKKLHCVSEYKIYIERRY